MCNSPGRCDRWRAWFFEFQMTSMLRDREKPASALIYSGLH